MLLFQQVNSVHEIYDCVLVLTTFAGVSAVRNVPNHGLRQSKQALAVACALLLMNITHAVLVPQSIDTLIQENESLVNATKNTLGINRNDQDFIMKLVNSMSVSLTALASRLLTLVRMKHHLPKILEVLHQVDVDLQLDRRVLQQNGRVVYLMIVFLLCLCIPLQLVSIFVIEPLQRLFVSVMFTLNAYNNLTIACCEFQFIILTYLMRTRLKFINDKLNTYGTVQRHTFLIDGGAVAANNKRHARTTTYYDIRMLHTSYKRLTAGLEQVNAYFNMQLLLSIACCNVNALISAYFAIFGGYYKPEDMTRAPQTVEDTLNDVIWGSYYFVRFFLLCAFASGAINECMRTSSEVAKIQGKFFDVQSAEEIKYFLQYSSNVRPKFTAFGFLLIDLHLVTSAIATGCTYLVIMAQFNNDKNSCKTVK